MMHGRLSNGIHLLILFLLSCTILIGCSDDDNNDDPLVDGDEEQAGDVETDGDGSDILPDGDIDSELSGDEETPTQAAQSEEMLREYFCTKDSDCLSGEVCLPFSDASDKVCQPENFIRFTDAQTFIIDTEGLRLAFNENEQGLDEIIVKGFGNLSEPGNPDLPSISFNVLLPPDADTSQISMEVLSEETVNVIGSYDLAPAGPANFRPDLENATFQDYLAQRPYIVDGKNTQIYNTDENWPASPLLLSEAAQMRKWKFVRATFFPFSYNPVSGKLLRTSLLRVHLSTPVAVQKSSIERRRQVTLLQDRSFDRQAQTLFSNIGTMGNRYLAPPPDEEEMVAKTDYAILTTNAIVSKSEVLEDFMAHKASIGYSVLLITEDDFGVMEGVDNAEKARNWLKQEYARRGIQYLLILSDPNGSDNGAPMRVCWPRYNKEEKKDNWEKTATDAYYADLNGNWDKDGDGIWCEYGSNNGDTGYGGVDLTPELYVGRIPVYNNNTDRLDDILRFTMDYELQQDIEWRSKVLLPNPISDFSHEMDHGDNGGEEEVNRGFTVDGAKYAERMKSDFLNASNKLQPFSLYDNRGAEPSKYDPDRTFSTQNVCDEWSKGYGITSWWAHGNSSSAAGKTWLEDTDNDGIADMNEKDWEDFAYSSMSSSCFDSEHPTHTVQVSCLNHRPDSSGNLGHSLLYKGGAVTTMGATSVTLYSPSWSSPNSSRMDNVSFGYYYTSYLAKNFSAGRALAMVRSKPCYFSWGDGTLMNMLSFNLYGDPSVSVFTTYQPAGETQSPLFEDKGHAFNKEAESDTGKTLRWDLYYSVTPGTVSGQLQTTIRLFDASGNPLSGDDGAVIGTSYHDVAEDAVNFDGDNPDRIAIDYSSLDFLGGGIHELQYAVEVVFLPDEGSAETFMNGDKKSFEIEIESESEIETLLADDPAEGALSDAVESVIYQFVLDANADLSVSLDGPEQGADFDLYVRLGEMPTTEDYDGRGYSSSADETVVIEQAQAGVYYIMVHKYSGAGEFSLTVSLAGTETAIRLPLDEVVEGRLNELQQELYYIDFQSSGYFSVILDSQQQSVFHLFLRKDEVATSETYDVASMEDQSMQSIEWEVTQDRYYLLVQAVTGQGSYQIYGWLD